MKKVLAIIMIFATLASFGSAYAAENTSTSVQYGVESTYSVVIPESAAVDASTKKAVLNFEATAKLDVGQAVRIYLQSASPCSITSSLDISASIPCLLNTCIRDSPF